MVALALHELPKSGLGCCQVSPKLSDPPVAVVREQVETDMIKVPDWFHDAMVDHAFRVNAAIDRHAAKASAEMELVKLDLWKLQQQQPPHTAHACNNNNDTNNAGDDELKQLGRRVEELAETLLRQQCTLQEVLTQMVPLAQAAAIAQQRCNDTDRRLNNAMDSTQVKSGTFSKQLPFPVCDASGGSVSQEQLLKACWEVEASISKRLEEADTDMRNFVLDHVTHVQDFAQGLEASIKRSTRTKLVEERIRRVSLKMDLTLEAVKATVYSVSHKKKSVFTRSNSRLFGAAQPKQQQELEEDNDQLMNKALASVEEASKVLTESVSDVHIVTGSERRDRFKAMESSSSSGIMSTSTVG